MLRRLVAAAGTLVIVGAGVVLTSGAAQAQTCHKLPNGTVVCPKKLQLPVPTKTTSTPTQGTTSSGTTGGTSPTITAQQAACAALLGGAAGAMAANPVGGAAALGAYAAECLGEDALKDNVTLPTRAQVEQAVDAKVQVILHPVQIGIVPQARTGKSGRVGLPVWMWVANPGRNTYGPLKSHQNVLGLPLEIQAHVTSVDWSMGDGTTVSCGEGTPYTTADGLAASPTCGHVYDTPSSTEPGGTYPVTATAHWVVDWNVAGMNGEENVDQTSATRIRIGELQVLDSAS